MSDLIDRQAAIDFIDAGHLCNPNEPRWSDNEVVAFLKSRPAAEPEVIRCKDCEWFRKKYGWNCIEYTVCGISPTHHPIRREEDFCSKAERKTDEAD